MDKKSRLELTKIVEAQKDQLSRYEKRLRDVVHAYKNLIQEKEALEASITALTATKVHAEPRDDREVLDNGRNKPVKSEGTESANQEQVVVEDGVVDHPLVTRDDEVPSDNQPQPHKENTSLSKAEFQVQDEKIATLTASLATVMQQKSKMEASFQADKKKMMQEHEVKLRETEEETQKLKQNTETLDKQLQELKLRMRREQQAREEEQNNHVLMLRELQMLLSSERSVKEDLEQQLDDAKEQVMLIKKLPGNKAEEYEQQISQLQLELQQVQKRLKEAEKASSKPSPLLVQLQEEMSKMKKENAEAVIREQKRANDAEERLRIITSLEECRVADLGEIFMNVLSEDDQTVTGNQGTLVHYAQQQARREAESTAIRRQKNDLEVALRDAEIRENQLLDQANVLKEEIRKLERDRSEAELEGFSKSELESVFVSDPSHQICQQQLRQLKEEFERYKLKTQALHKNKSYKELSEQLENMENFKSQNSELEKQLQDLKDKSMEREVDQKKIISNLRDQLQLASENYKLEKEEAHTVYKQKLEELERQVLNQRERTLALVAEKDSEIEMLRQRSPSTASSSGESAKPSFTYQRKFVQTTGGSQASLDSEADSTVHELLSKSAGVTGNQGTLVHYAQQQARREAESTAIRRQKNDLEVALRDAEIRENQLLDQANVLKEEIRKLERDRSRESANLEYLKNIVLRFMMSTSYSVKQQMIQAIATVLEFSPKELNQVRKVQSATWWGT
ncbi:PREDICTED: GRIP and coiled-coil domain-containing protein 1-like [Acropora digitifera]|uniref:GRIP and coiled-coil domain-containing protein 1-like n=1 Tax=Acropora digitifera TaxID=70779 RepID=UPI00077AD680|nr:PREDICTED: GRIP and coiled-coil domain-containing protein 1-like [Acropora digitifera]